MFQTKTESRQLTPLKRLNFSLFTVIWVLLAILDSVLTYLILENYGTEYNIVAQNFGYQTHILVKYLCILLIPLLLIKFEIKWLIVPLNILALYPVIHNLVNILNNTWVINNSLRLLGL